MVPLYFHHVTTSICQYMTSPFMGSTHISARLISGRLMPSGLVVPLLILLAWPLLMKARERPGLSNPIWIGHEGDMKVCVGL